MATNVDPKEMANLEKKIHLNKTRKILKTPFANMREISSL